MQKIFFLLYFLSICLYTLGQNVSYKELDYVAHTNPSLIDIDSSNGEIRVAAVLEKHINIQVFDVDSLFKLREVNIPIQLSMNEQIADFEVLNNKNLGVLLKTFTAKKIFIKSIHISAPGLISKPTVLLEMKNRQVELVMSESNPRKAVNKQVHIESARNKRFFTVINRQNLVCTSESNGVGIYCFNDSLRLVQKFNESNCIYKDLHVFNSGKIALTKNQQGKIVMDIYDPFLKSKTYTYQFPEIIYKRYLELEQKRDTFDLQVQFYFDDNTERVFAFTKGFVNNNYISHVGMYIYDVRQQKALLSQNNIHKTEEFVKYSISYRDNMAAYHYEYPIHLRIRHIRILANGEIEVVGDYMSYGRMPLENDFAGLAKSEATYLIQLQSNGKLINTKILLHRQSIISYPSNEDKTSTYQVDLDRVDKRVGQVYLRNDQLNFILHNNDKRAFYNRDRYYKFTYFGTFGSVALVKFSKDTKDKSKYVALNEYALLPMQANFSVSEDAVLCFATQKKKVKLLYITLAKP